MRPVIGARRRRLKHRLGFCWSCWRRGTLNADVAGYDHDGNRMGEATRYNLCSEHAVEWTRAVMSVPHSGVAEYVSGRTVEWSTENDA